MQIIADLHTHTLSATHAFNTLDEMAAKAGAKTVGLGPRILRCETAPLAVLSAVMTLTGNLE